MRLQIASIRSFDISWGIGIPATVERRGNGTIVSPWPPSTNAWTFSTDTFSSAAINARMRAESSTPAIPMTRSRGNPLSFSTAWHIASSGLATGTMMQLGEYFTTCSVTAFIMLKLTFNKSSRLMPGFRGTPDVMTTTSEFALCA